MSHSRDIIEIYVWYTTIWLAVISLTILSNIIIFRFFSDINKRKKNLRKNEITTCLFTHIENPFRNLKKILIKNKSDMELLAEVVPAIMINLKEESRHELLKSLNNVGLYSWVEEKLFSSRKK